MATDTSKTNSLETPLLDAAEALLRVECPGQNSADLRLAIEGLQIRIVCTLYTRDLPGHEESSRVLNLTCSDRVFTDHNSIARSLECSKVTITPDDRSKETYVDGPHFNGEPELCDLVLRVLLARIASFEGEQTHPEGPSSALLLDLVQRVKRFFLEWARKVGGTATA